jgi:hypothetical protein
MDEFQCSNYIIISQGLEIIWVHHALEDDIMNQGNEEVFSLIP